MVNAYGLQDNNDKLFDITHGRCRVEFDPPLKWSRGSITRFPEPEYAIRNEPP